MTIDQPDYPTITMDLNPVTRAMVFDFAKALGDKLRTAEIKYGRTDEWATQDWEAECRSKLLKHIDKGDPLDVAAYCAFMWSRGWQTNSPEQAPQGLQNQPGIDRSLSEGTPREGAPIAIARLGDAIVDLVKNAAPSPS